MIELVLSSAHLSPQPKQQIDRFSHFCEGHGRVLLGMSFALTNSTSIASAGFAELISMTDRQTNRETNRHTDHAIRSATICRIYVRSVTSDMWRLKTLTYLLTYLRSTAMLPNNNNLDCFNALHGDMHSVSEWYIATSYSGHR